MTDRDTLALAVFISGAFAHAGLDTAMFNHRTPLSEDLLLLVGEDLLEYEDLVEAATENLSVYEVLRGERGPTPSPTAAIQASWTRVQAGRSKSRIDVINAELYMVLCERLGVKPECFITRAQQMLASARRLAGKKALASKLRRRQ